MIQLSLQSFLSQQKTYKDIALSGAIFVYPTDTVYGLGAIISEETTKKINEIKQRKPDKHFSLIAPNFDRVDATFDINGTAEDLRNNQKDKIEDGLGLTIISPLKDGITFPRTIRKENGRRMIDHPFQDFVSSLGVPFITTSVNISGEEQISHISQISEQQQSHIDFFIDQGEITGTPSRIIHSGTGDIIRK